MQEAFTEDKKKFDLIFINMIEVNLHKMKFFQKMIYFCPEFSEKTWQSRIIQITYKA